MKTNFKKWPMESESTRMPRAPMRDGASQATIDTLRLAPDGFGLMLETPLVVVPVSSLPEAEREALILAHQERVEREMARLDNRTAANFPPPVAARLHGDRPYCATCATHYEAGGD